MIPPIVKLPVSPIKTCAGYVLYHKKPINAPANAATNIVTSPTLGIYIIFKYSEKIIFPETHANKPKVSTIIAELPAANPSIPSVRLAPLDTAVTIKITTGTKISHTQFL